MDISWAAEASYLAGKVVTLGLKAVGGNVEDTDKLVGAIEKLDFMSPRGRFRFGDLHSPINDYYLRRVEMVEGRMQNVVKEIYPNIGQGWMP